MNETGQRSTSEIVQNILNNIQEIIRSEVRLAKAEMKEEAAKAGKAAGLMGGAGILALYGLGALIVATLAALATVMPVWGAALIMTFLLFMAAGILYAWGRGRLRDVHPAQKTKRTLEDDVQWVKHRMT
jgi:uncharacterized membrane protein YqjE